VWARMAREICTARQAGCPVDFENSYYDEYRTAALEAVKRLAERPSAQR
jgi:hypothetical protein